VSVTNYANATDADAQQNELQAVEHTYDVYNRRIGKTVDSDGDEDIDMATSFVYDGNQIVLRLVDADGDGAGDYELTDRYVWGPQVDQILATDQIDPSTGDTDTLWTLTDNLGTVRQRALYNDGSGATAIVDRRSYDAFGNLTNQAGTHQQHLIGFTGRPFDAHAGLQNNLHRWYDATTGRWISEDPIGFAAGDANLSRYVSNGASNKVDPDGLDETMRMPWNKDGEIRRQSLIHFGRLQLVQLVHRKYTYRLRLVFWPYFRRVKTIETIGQVGFLDESTGLVYRAKNGTFERPTRGESAARALKSLEQQFYVVSLEKVGSTAAWGEFDTQKEWDAWFKKHHDRTALSDTLAYGRVAAHRDGKAKILRVPANQWYGQKDATEEGIKTEVKMYLVELLFGGPAGAANPVARAASASKVAPSAVARLRTGVKATAELVEDIAKATKLPRSRQTVVLIETRQGITIVAAGGTDLSSAQKKIARTRGLLVADDIPGFHAEMTGIVTAGEKHLLPTRGVVSGRMCNDVPQSCYSQLRAMASRGGYEMKLSKDGKSFSFIKRGM